MSLLSYRDPIPTNALKANVSTFAEQVACAVSYAPGYPIEAVVAQLGGAISYRNPVGEAKPESIRVEPDRSFKIFLSSMTSVSRDRFTIAHELGHLFLHFPKVQKLYPDAGMRAYRWVEDNNPQLQRCEWEANWFAASFVMPEQAFRDNFDGSRLEATALHFGVSEAACKIRAESLKLV